MMVILLLFRPVPLRTIPEATLFWNITSDLQAGAEYLRGWRTDFNGDTRHANRVNLAVQYSF